MKEKTLMALHDYATSILIGANTEVNDNLTMPEIIYRTQERGKISKKEYEVWSNYAKNIVYTLQQISIELARHGERGAILRTPKELQL